MIESTISKFEAAFEQGFIDVDKNDIQLSDLYRTVIDPDTRKLDKIAAGFSLIKRFSPEIVNQELKNRFGYSFEKSPFNPETYSINKKIGRGYVNEVFLLEASNPHEPSFVLKVNTLSKNQTVAHLVDTALDQQREYKVISAAYFSIHGLVPKEFHLIINNPRKRNDMPVAAMIQPFMGYDIRDIFALQENELKDMLRVNDNLWEQVQMFVEITKDNTLLIQNEVDILGSNNLSIVGELGEERLVFLDPHFTSKNSESKDRRAEIIERLNYLENIVYSL